MLFFISGYLINESLKKGASVQKFLISRALRIYPALITMLAFTIFIVGPAYTKNSLSTYFGIDTVNYFIRYALLIKGSSVFLPGVFTENPYGQTVNGSLWTLPWEVRCYLGLLIVWCAAKYTKFSFKLVTLCITIIIFLLYANAASTDSALRPTLFALTLFGLGVITNNHKNLVELSYGKAIILCFALLCAVFTNKILSAILILPTLGYCAICLSYLPRFKSKSAGVTIDYSYGTYLYAFPIQQMLVASYPNISGLQMAMISLPCTLFFAVLSWHLIEKKCLALKARVH